MNLTEKEVAWLNRDRRDHPFTKQEWSEKLEANNSLRNYFLDARKARDILNWIPPIAQDGSIPDNAKCQEASTLSGAFYIPCGAPAVAIVHHEKDGRSYYMCAPCADHNVRNRGGRLISTKEVPRHA